MSDEVHTHIKIIQSYMIDIWAFHLCANVFEFLIRDPHATFIIFYLRK